jgi:hypothetical protein
MPINTYNLKNIVIGSYMKTYIRSLFVFTTCLTLSAVTFAKGSSDAKIKEFLGKVSATQKQEILDDCKKSLGPSANGKSESALIDLCISKAKENIDPLDNYIDPDTLIDYEKEFASFSADKKKHVLSRCTMFVIQNEMGQTGEAAMSTREIETYEKKVNQRCEAILNKHMWGVDCTKDNQEECEAKKTLSGRLHEVERKGNLLTYTLDQCVNRLKLTKANCEAPGGLLGATCTLDFRRQCYDFITTESTYLEDPSRELRTCAEFEDQTKTIALDCRSYCYQKKVCEIKDEDFLNRVIGNIYLRKKKGYSSCVKDKSFGVAGDNKIWVHQSCYGEFGIQYKDPDCGYRPTCDVTPYEREAIDVQGKEDTFVTCDGNGSANPNDEDPRKNTASNGKVWCKAHLYKKDKNGKLTDEIDDTREITRIYSLQMLEKLGPHRCNPGGNGSPVDYLTKNKGSFDGGWGVEVINYCHGRFKLNVAWKKKECTMAGEESVSGNTCCNGLVYNEETKICNVPEFLAPSVPELAALESFNSNNQCNKQLPDNIIGQAESFFRELAVYENMFSLLDGKSDPINQISLEDKDKNKDVELNRKLENKAIKAIHDAILNFRHHYARTKLDYEEMNNKILCDMKEFMLIKTAETTSRVAKNLPKEPQNCEGLDKTLENVEAYVNYVGLDRAGKAGDKEKVELMKIPETNLLKEVTGIQFAAKVAQDFMIESNIAYTEAIMDGLNSYIIELDKAAIEGQNIVWNCAHKENCSEFSWLVKHAKADTYGRGDLDNRDKYRVITELLHSPIYPSSLLKSKAKILPELEPGYKKYIYNHDQYVQTEKEISEFEIYNPVIDYLNARMGIVKQPQAYKKVFQLYAQELPLRSNSILNEDDVFSEYSTKLKGTTSYSKDTAGDSSVPLFCEQQSKTNYQVRVPLGKALIPLRMVQMAEYLYRYIESQKNLLGVQMTCGYNLDNGGSRYSSQNYNSAGGVGSTGGTDKAYKAREGLSLKDMISKMPSFDGKAFLANNLIANEYLTNRQERGSTGNANGSSIGNVSSEGKSAIFTDGRKDRVKKTQLAIKQSKKKRNDNLIGKYVDSLKNSYGKALSTDSGSLFSKLKNSFLGGGFFNNDSSSKSKGSDSSSTASSDDSDSYDSEGSGYGFSGGDGLRRQSRSSEGIRDGKGGSSFTDQYGNPIDRVTGLTEKQSKKIIDESTNSKYDTYSGETLFEKISNRYIKSAYPHLLKFRKRKEID